MVQKRHKISPSIIPSSRKWRFTDGSFHLVLAIFLFFSSHNTHQAGPFHHGKHRGYLAVFLVEDMSWVLSRDFFSLWGLSPCPCQISGHEQYYGVAWERWPRFQQEVWPFCASFLELFVVVSDNVSIWKGLALMAHTDSSWPGAGEEASSYTSFVLSTSSSDVMMN